MANQFLLTNNTSSIITIKSLDNYELLVGATDVDMYAQSQGDFYLSDAIDNEELQSLIDSEEITAKDENGNLIKSTGSILPDKNNLYNRIVVDKKGGDYNSLFAAISNISDSSVNNKYSVFIGGGVFIEPPIIVPTGIQIVSTGATTLVPSDNDTPFLTFPNEQTSGRFGGAYIVSPSNSDGILIQNETTFIENVNFVGGNTGVRVNSNGRGIIATCLATANLAFGFVAEDTGQCDCSNIISSAVTGFYADGGSMWIQNCATNNDTNSLYANNSGYIKAYSIACEDSTNTFRTGLNGLNVIEGVSVSSLNASSHDIWQENADSKIQIVGGQSRITNLEVVNWDNIYLEYSTSSDTERFHFKTVEEHIGVIEKGAELSVGEGDSTSLKLMVYTESSLGVFNDVTSQAVSENGSTFTFSDNSFNSALYISIDRLQDGDYYKFGGIKIKYTQPMVVGGGGYVMEYWNGSSWVEIKCMATNANTPYESYANEYLKHIPSPSYEHTYFNARIQESWMSNDPTSTGIDRYWVRLRITDTVSTPIVIEHIKIHTNHTEINPDGWKQMQGKARDERKLDWGLAGTQAFGGNTPSNIDLYLGDRLGFGANENRFQNNALDIVGFRTTLPLDIDTSTPIRLILYAMTPDNPTGTSNITIRYGYVNTTSYSDIYTSTGSSPTTANNEISIFQEIQFSESNKLQVFEFDIDVSDLKARNVDSTPPDMLVLSIERDGSEDSFSGNFILVEIEGRYRAWCDGGFPILLSKTSALNETWESGDFSSNSWNVLPSSSPNRWVVGTSDPCSGAYSAYITNNESATPPPTTYTSSNNTFNTMYIDVFIPNTAKSPRIAFDFKGEGELGYDYMNVYAMPTSVTPITDEEIDISYRVGQAEYNSISTHTNFSIPISPIYIGQTLRIAFQFRCDNSVEGSTGANVDNIDVWYLS